MSRKKSVLLETIKEAPFWTKLIITESKKEKLPDSIIMQAKCKFGHAGIVTENGRLYSRKLIGREVTRLQESISRRAVQGLSGHPDPGKNPDPDRVAFIITGLEMMESGETLGSIDILDTPSGKIMATKAKAGAEVGLSSRGPGSAVVEKLTNEHPDFAENKEWQGKDVEFVNEDYRLITYDHVIGQAVKDATMSSFNEDENREAEQMKDFEVEKLTDENWKLILDSEKFKATIAEAVKAQLKLNEDAAAESTLDYLGSDQFLEDHFKEEGEDTMKDKDKVKDKKTDDKTEAAAKCAKCGAALTAGAKFCASCGAKVEKKESIEPLDQGKYDSLKKENEDLKGRIDSLEQNAKERREAKEIDVILEEAFASQPASVVEAVKKDFIEMTLTPENVKSKVDERITHYAEFVKQTGGNLEESIGTRIAHNLDRDADGKLKEESDKVEDLLTEDLDTLLQ
ncbi:MAG: zinc-ribbon domain-containing protein [Candidatus Thorarchaeota archaeon]